MLNPASPLARLMDAPMQPGRVVWLGLRPARHADLLPQVQIAFHPESGIAGDHYAGRSGTRQVTLIQAEHLAAIASHLGRDGVTPAELRRNIVVGGINLGALKARRFWVGTALLEHTGECHPCSRMEAIFGPGGYNAVRGHGGILARIIAAGTVRIGDRVASWTAGETPG